jgi:acyl carrier protein
MANDDRIDPATLTDAQLLEHVRSFVADAADCSEDVVGDDTELYVKLKIDSLGIVAVFIDVAYTFGVPEPSGETEYRALDNPRKIVEFIRSHQKGGDHEQS